MFHFVTEPASKLTASAVRAELARRQITQTALRQHFGWSTSTSRRRLIGETPFKVDELVKLAAWLDVPVTTLLPQQDAAA